MGLAQPDSRTKLEILQEILHAATREASACMCRWTGGLITLTLDSAREIPVEEVSEDLGLGVEMVTMVVLTLDEEVGGTLVLIFDKENGRRLASTLTKQEPGSEPTWTDLERSALNETGNILGCAFFNSIARLIGFEFVPSVPMLIEDYGACVVQQALVDQLGDASDVLVCQTTFHRGGEELNWSVLFIPNSGLRSVLEDSI